MLNFFAAVFHFGETQGSGRSFEEMTFSGEVHEFAVFAKIESQRNLCKISAADVEERIEVNLKSFDCASTIEGGGRVVEMP